MRLNRFYVNRLAGLRELWIDGDEARHILKVCRLREGDELSLFDGSGCECLGEIVEIDKRRLLVRVNGEKRMDRELGVKITIAAAVPKGKRAETMIQKCAELGLHKFIPIKTARSVVDVSAREETRIERWKKICIEASKQSGRNLIAEVDRLREFSEILNLASGNDLAIVASPGGASLKEIIGGVNQMETVICVIGPEGGFTTDELESARASGFAPTAIAPSILRVETAAIAVTAMLAYALGECQTKHT